VIFGRLYLVMSSDCLGGEKGRGDLHFYPRLLWLSWRCHKGKVYESGLL